ncbi:MAG: hypothetical protein IJD97_00830 [Clostridia bacterium]|nr:hypothetical protein [Clostridia bacterium]
MKKILVLMLALMMVLSVSTVLASSGDIVLMPSDATENKGIQMGNTISDFAINDYFGYKDVDLTGINSVIMEAYFNPLGGHNGEAFRIMIDDPVEGSLIGTIVLSNRGGVYDAFINPTAGKHNVYFVASYNTGVGENLQVKKVTFSKAAYEDNAFDNHVGDEYIKDFYEDTWVATDSYGRRVADYAEAGPVKTGEREVGMMYWNWWTPNGTSEARIISDVIKKYPDAMQNQSSPGWSGLATYYWDEPAIGFYSGNDYWAHRYQLELLAAAGVDAIFLDFSNGGAIYLEPTNVLLQAMRDLKKDGVNVPEFSVFAWHGGLYNLRLMEALYNNYFYYEDFSDVWYHLDGKPLICGLRDMSTARSNNPNKKDLARVDQIDFIEEFFTFRENVNAAKNKNDKWTWCEDFPQGARNGVREDGRIDFMNVTVALNHSYGPEATSYAMGGPYTMGRNYSPVFGEDRSENGAREAHMFRAQAGRVLEFDPHFVYVDGWNEWTAQIQNQWGQFAIAFVDTFDTNDSRDFEPTKGQLKDDYYNLLVDFMRKHKGVRPAPSAGEAGTIDIAGDLSQWDNVKPEFLNYKGVDRNSEALYKVHGTGEKRPDYVNESGKRVVYSKVQRDSANLYFMAKTVEGEDIAGTNLYLNTDRNYSTGLEGYDYIIGRDGSSNVEAITPDGTYTVVGTANIVRSGNVMQIAVPRATIGETGTVEIELKWVNGTFTDVIELYEKGNAAPIARFNYLYTEKADFTTTAAEREALKDAHVLVAGKTKMLVNGKIETVNEKDSSKYAFEMNGTLYIPSRAFEELLGYGRGRIEYDYLSNMFYYYHFDYNEDKTEVAKTDWYYSVVGSYEARANGRLKTLSAPVIYAENDFYVPASIFAETMDIAVTNLGNGVYVIGNADASVVNSALHYLD